MIATVPSSSAEPNAGIRLPERRRGLQLAAGILLYVLCQVAMTAAAVAVFAAGAGAGAGEDGASATIGEILAAPGAAAPVGFAVGAVVAIAGFVAIVRGLSRRPVAEFSRPGALREIGWGLLIGAGVVAAAVGVLGLLGVYRIESLQVTPGLIAALMLGVGPAVMEEVFFRGILLRLFDGWFGSWAALVLVSILFALVHSFSSPAGPVAALFVLASASLLLNMAYLLTRRLWLPIALHLAFNAAQAAIFGLGVSGSTAGESLITPSLDGPDWLTGGTMGGEGSLVVIAIALAAGVALTVVAVRRRRMLARSSRTPEKGAAREAASAGG